MAYNSFETLWQSDFYDNVFAENRVHDINLNQLKLKVNDTYRKNEKITTKFKRVHDEDVISKLYLDRKLSKIEGHQSLIEKDYSEYNMRNDKHPEKVSIESAVKMAIQTLYDKGIFVIYDIADGVF